ncbi:MAG: AAA family ATPase [Thiomonas sp. 13-66-29]|jgi:DNA replication protein DnaC|nr:MAG: AAA family ATPase [Thiomonas sp. 13-66-29]
MLIQQTLTQLRGLRLHAMADALEHQCDRSALQALSFEERLAMLVEVECQSRDTRRIGRLLKTAKLKIQASPEDIDYGSSRGLDKRQIASLLGGDWIQRGQNLIVTGATGVGKTWLACAFGQQAVRQGHAVAYHRLPRLLEEVDIAREDGSLPKLRAQLARARLLILDDWGVAKLTPRGRQELLEIVDDRVGTLSLVITAQMPIAEWHACIGEPTIADAILDRVVHNAHRIELKGDSMRKRAALG